MKQDKSRSKMSNSMDDSGIDHSPDGDDDFSNQDDPMGDYGEEDDYYEQEYRPMLPKNRGRGVGMFR